MFVLSLDTRLICRPVVISVTTQSRRQSQQTNFRYLLPQPSSCSQSTMLRRRRSLLLKIVIGSAVVYISFLLLVGRGASDSSNSKSSEVKASEREARGTPGPLGQIGRAHV